MPAKIDLKGKKFSRLVVLKEIKERAYNGSMLWECKCSCGKIVNIRSDSLRSGNTKSCGCLQLDSSTKHGMERTPEYKAWGAMLQRCENSNNKAYHNYGGRGITICSRWHEFKNFNSDMGKRPSPKHSLDLINNNGNYEPSNCKWSIPTEQHNNKRTNIYLDYKGERLTQEEVARKEKVHGTTIADRLVKGLFKRWNK